MRANYSIEHNAKEDALGNENYSIAVQRNYHALNMITTSYWTEEAFMTMVSLNENTVAIFKLKPKP